MKIKIILCALLTTGFLSVLASGCCCSKAQLEAQARISKADAEKTALAKVPGGTVKESDIEKENGKLVWSFDISIPNSPDIMEVQVDALTGEVISAEKESPAKQAKEKEEDAKEKKK